MIGLGDVALEHRFDLRSALELYGQLEETLAGGAPDATWKDAEPDMHIRLGICAYVRNALDEAAKRFATAERLRPDTRWGEGIAGGIGQFAEACKERKRLVPSELTQGGDDRTRLVLLLGSVYTESWQDERGERLFARVAAGEFPATREQRAWARMKQGDCLRLMEWHDIDRKEEALACWRDFERGGPYANTSWADDALIRIGVLYCGKSATRARGLEYFKTVVTRYPNSDQASRAQLYIGMHLLWAKQYPQAIAEFKKLIAVYPQSIWAEQAQRELIPRALREMRGEEP